MTMRVLVGWLLWGIVLHAAAQTLVVAGCESESQVKTAEQLIEKTREKDWQRSKWIQQCYQAGFEVVGDTNVAYLIPAYYTPRFADRVAIPIIDFLLKQPAMACRLQDLSPELQQAILSATQRPQLALFVAQEPSVESLHTKLLNGEILISVLDLWWFKTTDENGEEIAVFAESKRLFPNQTMLLSLFAPPRPSGQSATPKAPSHERGSQKRWSFIFSHPLPAHQQMEHIKAYIEWLSALQRQMHAAIPQTSAQLWKMLYADKVQPQVGSSYSFGELQSLLGEDARLMLPSDLMSRLSNSPFTFHKWEVGIGFIKRDGGGTARHFVPLEVLLGLRGY